MDALLSLPVADIAAGDRLRPVDAEWASALASIMLRDGQLTPIEVCRLPGKSGWTLVTGAHRLAAVKQCGWPEILAIEVSSDRVERRLREVSENLWRRGLSPMDRAAFIAELVELARAQSGVSPDRSSQKIAADARWQKVMKNEAVDASVIVTDAYGWTSEVAAKVGVSLATVERDLLLHRRLSPTVSSLLRGHSIFENAAQMRALAKLDGSDQQQVAGMLAACQVKSVSEGLAVLLQKPKPDAEMKRYRTVIDTIGRMGKAERQAMFDTLAARVHAMRTGCAGEVARV